MHKNLAEGSMSLLVLGDAPPDDGGASLREYAISQMAESHVQLGPTN